MEKLKSSDLPRKTVEEFRRSGKTPLIFVLDNIRSAINVGSVFRTADAFLLEGIYLCGITATPPHRDILKTALGATETVSWKYSDYCKEAILELRKMKYKIIGAEHTTGSVSLDNFDLAPGGKIAVVFGNEITGISQDIIRRCDACIEIPQIGTKHSLNVAVSAGIIAWDLFLKLNASK